MPIAGDKQGTQSRAVATESKYPTGSDEEPPAVCAWQQFLAGQGLQRRTVGLELVLDSSEEANL